MEEQQRKKQAFVEELKSLPIAVQTSVANEQHYEACCPQWINSCCLAVYIILTQ